MNSLEALADFIEFCLFPYYPLKTIQLTQFKISKKLKKMDDEYLITVSAFSRALHELKSLRKHSTVRGPQQWLTAKQKLYLELTQLEPSDCFILLARDRYKIDDATTSLILKRSEANLSFRRHQLEQKLKEEGLDLKGLPVADLTELQSKESTSEIYRTAFPPSQKKLSFALRFTLETAAVLGILVLLMWIIPEIRNKYENSIQKRINDYLIEASLTDSPAPEGTSKAPKAIIAQPVINDPETLNSSSRPGLEDSPQTKARHAPKVNEGETWRFSFAGSLTNDIETEISEILKKLNVDDNKPITVPGGIQFDFSFPVSNVLALKTELENMTADLQKKTTGAADSSGNPHSPLSLVNMSWYKKRILSARKIPSGHVQVVIWISTL